MIINGMKKSATIIKQPMEGTPTNARGAHYKKLSVDVQFEDSKVREKFAQFDGFERVFARAPDLQGQWHNFDLQFQGSKQVNGKNVDIYHGEFYGVDNNTYLPGGLRNGINLDEVMHFGVAFGFQAGNQEHYLQDFAQNTAVQEAGSPPPGFSDEFNQLSAMAREQGFNSFGTLNGTYFVRDQEGKYWGYDPVTRSKTEEIDPASFD